MKAQLSFAPHPASGGPQTPEGKAVSSLNRLVHGLAGGQFRVLPSESQADFDAAAQALIEQFKPSNALEAELIRRMAEHSWLARRAQTLCDAALINDDMKKFALMLRYQTANNRAFSSCLNDLLRFRREQRKASEFESKSKLAPLPVRLKAMESNEDFDSICGGDILESALDTLLSSFKPEKLRGAGR